MRSRDSKPPASSLSLSLSLNAHANAKPSTIHAYEVRSRKDHRGADLISDTLPFGRLWYDKPENAIGYAMHCSRSHDAVIRVYDDAGNVIETHQRKGESKEWWRG